MQITFHVTKACNLRCRYCYYRDFPTGTMSLETARAATRQVLELGDPHMGVTFFGGEPLLAKALIRQLVPEIEDACRQRGITVNFKIPTNGLLLDREFLEFCEARSVFISLSIDGDEEGNVDRVTASGRSSFAEAKRALALLRSHASSFATYSVVTPANAGHLFESLEGLYREGSRILISSLDYGADWSVRDLKRLRRQYELLADFYIAETRKHRHFHLSIFDSRIRAHTRPDQMQDTACRIGLGQISVGPDGTYYPCIQFVENPDFAIGNVASGIDFSLRRNHFEQSGSEAPECAGCGIHDRCSRNCACVSWQTTGTLDGVAPIVCEHERLLMPIADSVARRLFRKREPLFIARHYNPDYDMLRALEEIVVHNHPTHETFEDSAR